MSAVRSGEGRIEVRFLLRNLSEGSSQGAWELPNLVLQASFFDSLRLSGTGKGKLKVIAAGARV